MEFLRVPIMLFSAFSLISGIAFCGHAQDKNKDQRLMGSGTAIIGGSVLTMLGIAGETVNWLLGLVIAVGGYVSAIRRTREISREEARAFLAELELEEKFLKIEFYNQCIRNGVTACRTAGEIQKATLIARRMELDFEDIADLFAQCRALAEEQKAEEQEDALAEKRRQERRQAAELRRYGGYTGREKRIAMLTDLCQEAERSAQVLQAGARALVMSTQEKERDWAVAGGFASGLAGPAAGLAAAMEVQAENEQIRARNARNLQAVQPLVQASLEGSGSAHIRASDYERELEAAKIKLVAEDTAEACLERLTFRDAVVTVSETGTCHVRVKVGLKAPFRIFGDVDAVVDGTVLAELYSGGRYVGSAELVLPLDGIGWERTLEGMCLFCGKPGESCTVEKFTAGNLWAMER